jgi:hypothetical protein
MCAPVFFPKQALNKPALYQTAACLKTRRIFFYHQCRISAKTVRLFFDFDSPTNGRFSDSDHHRATDEDLCILTCPKTYPNIKIRIFTSVMSFRIIEEFL